MKVNFDGAIFRETNESSLGVIVRDNQGRVRASFSKNVPILPSSNDVGSTVAVRAIRFARELGLSSIILEGDSEVVINVLKSTESSLASFSHLIDSVKTSLEAFKHTCFLHTRRLGNFAAHNLTKHARGLSV